MIKYAHRLPPGAPLELIGDNIVRKTERYVMMERLAFMEKLCRHFMNHPDPMVVPVLSFSVLRRDRNDSSYSYDMVRLGLLSEEEKHVINIFGDLVDRHSKRAVEFLHSSKEYDLILQAQKDYPNLIKFLSTLITQGRYHDLHGGNIMMDLEENYRIIDLEGFWTGYGPNNNYDWITNYE